LLTFFHEWRIVSLRHFDAAVPQEQRHTIDRHSPVEQLNRECVAEHMSVTPFRSSVWPANLCEFEQTRKRTSPALAGGLGIPVARPKKVSFIFAREGVQNVGNVGRNGNVDRNPRL